MNIRYNGLPVIVNNNIPGKYKQQLIKYHTPIRIPPHIKRYNYKPKTYIKKIKMHTTMVVDTWGGKVIIMDSDTFEKLKDNFQIF